MTAFWIAPKCTGLRAAAVGLVAATLMVVAGIHPSYGQSQKQNVKIKVGDEATFNVDKGPSITIDKLGTFVEGTSTYDFSNNICGQGNSGNNPGRGNSGNNPGRGNGGNNPCWKVEAEIESGDRPDNVTLKVKLEKPPTQKPNFNDPSSTGFQTLEEGNAKTVLEDIGNTDQSNLDITYKAKATVEAVPNNYEVTVVYTLLEDS